MSIFAKNADYMIYKKNVRQLFDEERVRISLSLEYGGRQISAIAYDGEKRLASIVSVIHNIDELKNEKCYEILLVESVNSIDTSLRINIMFRLQKFFYENLHKLGVRYFWFETKNQILISLAEMLYSLYRIKDTNCYYADLDKMFYHYDEQSDQ